MPGDGLADDGSVYDVDGIDTRSPAVVWAMNGGDSADNQTTTSSFISTSGILPAEEFPQFECWPSARWDKPGGPFDPHTGEQYVYSQIADVSYKRLTQEIAVPAPAASSASGRPTTPRRTGTTSSSRPAPPGGDWTTLPDLNGHTSTETGLSCANGWRDLHPQLDHYQT